MKRWAQVVSTIVLGLMAGGVAVAEQLSTDVTTSRIDEVKTIRGKSGDVWNYKVDENNRITSVKRAGPEGHEISFAYEGNSRVPAARRLGDNPWRHMRTASDAKASPSENPFATFDDGKAEVRRFEGLSSPQPHWSVQPKAKGSSFAIRNVMLGDGDLTDLTPQQIIQDIQFIWNDWNQYEYDVFGRKDKPEDKAACRQRCDDLEKDLNSICIVVGVMNVYTGAACAITNWLGGKQCKNACG